MIRTEGIIGSTRAKQHWNFVRDTVYQVRSTRCYRRRLCQLLRVSCSRSIHRVTYNYCTSKLVSQDFLQANIHVGPYITKTLWQGAPCMSIEHRGLYTVHPGKSFGRSRTSFYFIFTVLTQSVTDFPQHKRT